jgi:cytochrome oxidase Cu insertion factor (SCO1/SenC/PrrC family)
MLTTALSLRRGPTAEYQRFVRGIAAALVLAATSFAPYALAAEPALPAGLSAPAKPTLMPAFNLPTTAGKRLDSASLKGQVLVIRFWASW